MKNQNLTTEPDISSNGVFGAVVFTPIKWVFCNAELEPFPYEWSSNYKCPKCGNNLVNILGTCATKVFE